MTPRSARSCLPGRASARSRGGDMAEQVEAIEGKRPARRGAASAGVRTCSAPTHRRDPRLLLWRRGLAGMELRHPHQWRGRSLEFPRRGLRSGARAAGSCHGCRRGKGQELLSTGDDAAGGGSLRIGLVNHVVPSWPRYSSSRSLWPSASLPTRLQAVQAIKDNDRAGTAGRARRKVFENQTPIAISRTRRTAWPRFRKVADRIIRSDAQTTQPR